MGSYTKLTYHVIYGTKFREKRITEPFRERLYAYIGGIVRANKGHLIEIGGVEDHVHLVVNFSASQAVSDTIRDVKASSSKWFNELEECKNRFEWQKGYSAFTVSYSQIDVVRKYVQNQMEHHRTKTFEEEYISFLVRHGFEVKREYLFEGEHLG